jgi:hypothetical protein
MGHFPFFVPLPFGLGFGLPPIVNLLEYPIPFGMADSFRIVPLTSVRPTAGGQFFCKVLITCASA